MYATWCEAMRNHAKFSGFLWEKFCEMYENYESVCMVRKRIHRTDRQDAVLQQVVQPESLQASEEAGMHRPYNL